jgi:hypothetical protein
MSEVFHPAWCDRVVCTAHADGDVEQAHRTTPVVVPTLAGETSVYVYASARPDGADVTIEISELREPVPAMFFLADTSWYVNAGELSVTVGEAAAIAHAIEATHMRVGALLGV